MLCLSARVPFRINSAFPQQSRDVQVRFICDSEWSVGADSSTWLLVLKYQPCDTHYFSKYPTRCSRDMDSPVSATAGQDNRYHLGNDWWILDTRKIEEQIRLRLHKIRPK